MILYISSDISSPHTAKRERWFIKNGFNFKTYGFENSSNSISIDKDKRHAYLKIKSGPLNYFNRVISAFKLCFDLSKELKQGITIVRGFEFILPLNLFRIKFYYELTDIPEIFFRLKPLRLLLKVSLKNSKLLMTSGGYNEVLNFERHKIFIWHNDPMITHHEENHIQIKNKSKDKIIYSGYLRGIKHLIHWNNNFLEINFYGKRNILGENFNFNEFIIGYKGEYNPSKLYDIFNLFWYSYISDYKGQNSRYNLTNRLYESILHLSIPIELRSNYQEKFMRKEKIFFLNNTSITEDMTLKALIKISNGNRKTLSRIIERDNISIINEFNQILKNL